MVQRSGKRLAIIVVLAVAPSSHACHPARPAQSRERRAAPTDRSAPIRTPSPVPADDAVAAAGRQSAAIARWHDAVEGYQRSVAPDAGRLDSLDAAHFVNAVHDRVHSVFFPWLESLDSLVPPHPLSRRDLAVTLEIVLEREQGRIVRMGVLESSGVDEFDIGALDAFDRAQPFGRAPRELAPKRGELALHWQLHREPYLACTTYYARLYAP